MWAFQTGPVPAVAADRSRGRTAAGHAALPNSWSVGLIIAVAECRLRGDRDIGTTWRMLWEWAQQGPYRWRRAQELEKVLNPAAPDHELVLELFLPVAETAESHALATSGNS